MSANREGTILIVLHLPQHFQEVAELIGFIGERWPDSRLTHQDVHGEVPPVGYVGSTVIEIGVPL